MKDADFNEIDKIMQAVPNTAALTRLDIARTFVNKHPNLAALMVEDWIGSRYKTWFAFFKKTAIDGYRFDPSRAQSDVLRRMRDHGDTVGPIHGKFRWLEGSDVFLSKRTIEVLFQEGWIERTESTHTGVEYEFKISDVGLLALDRFEHGV